MNKVDYKIIGKRLQSKRKEMHITQQAMSDNIDVSTFYLSKIENGHVNITIETLAEICDFLGLDIDYAVSGTETTRKNYLNDELSELFNGCSPKKKEAIVDIIKVIANIPE